MMGLKIQVGIFLGKPVKASDLKEAEIKMRATLDFLEKHFSDGKLFICGKNMTIADLLIFHEATNLEFYKIDVASWSKVNEWYNRMLENNEIAKIHQGFRDSLPASIAALDKVEVVE